MLVPEEEVLEAVEDGVQLLNGWSPKDFIVEDGELRKLLLQRCLRVFDDNFRFAPEFDSADLRELESGLVITAVGQNADLDYLDEDINRDSHGKVVLNTALQPSADRVFVTGDIKAPGLVIGALGEGKRAAMSIDSYLGGAGIYFGRAIDIPDSQLDMQIWDLARERAAKLEPARRRQAFAEVEFTFSPEQAHQEANRCMRCDRNSVQELYLRTFPEGDTQAHVSSG